MNQLAKAKEAVRSAAETLWSFLVTPTAKVSVFGAAPSLSVMLKMNQKKIIFYGATFWYYYRILYPYVFPVVFLTFMIVALTAWNTVKGHLVLGSILSLISSTSVVMSYIMIMPWRKHPSSLILYRALTSTVFSVNIILNAIDVTSRTCRNYAVVTQVMLLAGTNIPLKNDCQLSERSSAKIHDLHVLALDFVNCRHYFLSVPSFFAYFLSSSVPPAVCVYFSCF